MRPLTFGVVGPVDLVPPVADIVARTQGIRAMRLPYRQEQEAVRIVRDNADDVDAWLFTGVIPHVIASAAQVVSCSGRARLLYRTDPPRGIVPAVPGR